MELLPKSERLSSQNYAIWSVKVRNMLTMKNLWDVVVNTAPTPTSSNATEVANFNAKDQRAMACISLNVETGILVQASHQCGKTK